MYFKLFDQYVRGRKRHSEVMVFAKEVGLFRKDNDGSVIATLQVAPLFETIEDLHAAPDIMRKLFNLPIYREAVSAMNELQEIMLGYPTATRTAVPLPRTGSPGSTQRYYGCSQ